MLGVLDSDRGKVAPDLAATPQERLGYYIIRVSRIPRPPAGAGRACPRHHRAVGPGLCESSFPLSDLSESDIRVKFSGIRVAVTGRGGSRRTRCTTSPTCHTGTSTSSSFPTAPPQSPPPAADATAGCGATGGRRGLGGDGPRECGERCTRGGMAFAGPCHVGMQEVVDPSLNAVRHCDWHCDCVAVLCVGCTVERLVDAGSS